MDWCVVAAADRSATGSGGVVSGVRFGSLFQSGPLPLPNLRDFPVANVYLVRVLFATWAISSCESSGDHVGCLPEVICVASPVTRFKT